MKIAVVYWSGTGNTQAMAEAIAEGARGAGAEVEVYTPANFNASMVGNFDALAFGCSAQGAEVLEEYEFEPMFDACEKSLPGKRVALFGSYDWGDGEWMRNWESRCTGAGIKLACDSLIVNNTPDADGVAKCKEFGAALAK